MPGTDTSTISVFYRVIKFGLPKSQAMIITDKKSVIMRAKNCKSSFLEKTVIQVLVNKKRSHTYSPKTQISVSVRHLNDVQILAQSINIILPIPKVTCSHQNISKLSPWFTVDVITALSIIPIRIISIKSFPNLQLPPHLHACAKSTWCFYFTLNDWFVSKCIKFKILSNKHQNVSIKINFLSILNASLMK